MLNYRFAALCAFLSLFISFSHAQTCINLGGVNPFSHSQSFDGLGTSPAPQNGDPLNIQILNASGPRRYLGKFDNAVADNSSVVHIPGWALVEEGTNNSSVTGRYNVGDGSASGGNTYSFGTNSDRAFGSINDDTIAVNYLGGCFRNTSGTTLSSVRISFIGEMWRRGAAGVQTDRLDFSYAVNAANIYAGSFLAFPSLDFTTPDVSGAAGPRDGNAAANRTVFPLTVLPVNLLPGDAIYVRWIDQNIATADDGLAIDDFAISFLQTSAANVDLAGRVYRENGKGIGLALVSLSDEFGNVRSVRTNTFGYYRFADVAAGRQYVLSVAARGVTFRSASTLIDIQDSISNADFVGSRY